MRFSLGLNIDIFPTFLSIFTIVAFLLKLLREFALFLQQK